MGLPGAGKTTVFNALTGAAAATGTFGASTDEANLASVKVPDPRLDKLTEMFKPQRKVPAVVQYLDVAGMAKGVAEKGMSGSLLNNLSQADALLHVVRAFEDPSNPHPDGGVDPVRDIETIDLELLFADLSRVENRLTRIASQLPKQSGREREATEREQLLMQRLKESLESEIPVREMLDDLDEDDLRVMRGFGFLTGKPLLILINLSESQLGAASEEMLATIREKFARRRVGVGALAGEIEMEIGQLDDDDKSVFMEDLGITESGLDQVIRQSFDLLGLMAFFTVGPDECRAWTIRQGETALEAASAIHSDIQRGFIRAEIVGYNDLVETGGMNEAKKAGKFRREGKEYIFQDGDVTHFLFNV